MRTSPFLRLLSLFISTGLLVAILGLETKAEELKLQDAKPSTLVVASGAILVTSYFTQIALHELSHVAAAKYYGAENIQFSIIPSKDPEDGSFRLGYTQYEYRVGSLSDHEHANILLAPLATSLLVTNTYLLTRSGRWFSTASTSGNEFSELGMSIFAAAASLDLLKNAIDWRASSDLEKAANFRNWSKDQELGIRVTLGALALLTLTDISCNLWGLFSRYNEKPKPESWELGFSSGGVFLKLYLS